VRLCNDKIISTLLGEGIMSLTLVPMSFEIQLSSQRSLLKAFSEFEEHAIAFPPTYKYDVGTNIWDSR